MPLSLISTISPETSSEDVSPLFTERPIASDRLTCAVLIGRPDSFLRRKPVVTLALETVTRATARLLSAQSKFCIAPLIPSL